MRDARRGDANADRAVRDRDTMEGAGMRMLGIVYRAATDDGAAACASAQFGDGHFYRHRCFLAPLWPADGSVRIKCLLRLSAVAHPHGPTMQKIR